MEENKRNLVDEEAKASLEIWRYLFGFADISAAKCAIDLKVPEALENNPSSEPMTLAELSSATSTSQSHLHRIMRFLVHLEMLAPWLKLSSAISSPVNGLVPPFDAVHGKELWSFAKDNPRHSELINEAMACEARRVVPLVAGACHGLFDGVATVVDVGGGTGDTMAILVKEFPWIKGINFDLPHVVEVVQVLDNVENVGGDMFDSIPACDAVFIKSVLHDWGDEYCIKILKNCKEALPPKTGKVLIVEPVVGEKKKTMIMEERDEKLGYVRLALDMIMMVHTSTCKERTLKEWDFVIKEADFARYEVRDIDDVQWVIIAYPS
ncbi:hypothetical protein F2Q68_00033309 [Brassica cretica]|uniref:O-methyltransferase domain-containing protein n=1 Tax=Brassica cretica TaxID=69181 RepID=A0A8S9GE82_BRACR|nr:hypothetical protein F2Q68_00033309 [Brassica cretica]